MKIELSKTTVNFTPEADHENTMLEGRWRMLVGRSVFSGGEFPDGADFSDFSLAAGKNITLRFRSDR